MSRRRVYDPQVQLKEETFWAIRASLGTEIHHAFFEGPLALEIQFHMPIPKSLSKKKQQDLLHQPHVRRPDLDNLIKFYCDVCTNLLYKDDSQVYTINASKMYSQIPQTVIKLTKGAPNGFNS